MGASGPIWFALIAVIVALVVFDYLVNIRRTHTPTLREAAVWSAIYAAIAIAFGIGVWAVGGISLGVEYFACYVSNEALSIDNLFVFLYIVGSFAVPRIAQQKVLLFGIVFALVARIGFIFLGAALVTTFDWAFYLFGVVLLIMAANLAKRLESEGRNPDSLITRIARRLLRTSENYDGDRLFAVENGRRVMTPMLVAMIAVGGADVLFAFDSIPALFGLSRNVALVLSATALSLLGLRQLYFLIDGLLDRLVYLSYGLAAVLAFIGANLLLQALHDNNIPFINGGHPVPVAEAGTMMSLTVIVVILGITTAASLLSRRGRAQNAEESEIAELPTQHRSRIRRSRELSKLLGRAHRAHDAPATGSRPQRG
jgi:tellurite resistance protein TerC